MDRHHSGARPARTLAEPRGDGAVVCSLLRHVMALGRVMKIYAPGHSRVVESVVELESIANEVFRGSREGLEIVVHPDGLRVDGRHVHHEPAVTESFSEVLRSRGVRALLVRPGIDQEELFLLADLLGRPARDIITDGGLEAILEGERREHFEFVAASSCFGDAGDSGEAGGVPGGAAPRDAAVRQLEEILGELGELPPEPPGEHRLVYTACDKDGLGTRSSNLLAVAEETLRAESARHDTARTAALVLCDMVGCSSDALEYRRRRDLLCEVVRDKRLDPRAMRIAQLHLAKDIGGDWPHENPDALLLELGTLSADTQLLETVLGRTSLSAADARRIAENLAARPDGFDLLVVLLKAPLPEPIAAEVGGVLLQGVAENKTDFRKWATRNPQRFLSKPVFARLLKGTEGALGPVVRAFLSGSGSKNRDRLIELLVEDGSEKALRLLVLGVRDAGEIRDPRVILAFGKFKHALAVGVLREVVQRCNTERFDADEAASAIRALAESGSEAAIDFLEEISHERRFLLPVYRRSLRELAQDALEVA